MSPTAAARSLERDTSKVQPANPPRFTASLVRVWIVVRLATNSLRVLVIILPAFGPFLIVC